jgi:AcrR family transcriptional regulator
MSAIRRTARRPLTRDAIAAAALDLIDRDGLEEFSTRKLGQALGVEAMSLYHHFPSKGELLDAVSERLMAEVALPTWAPGGDWIDWLRQVAHAYRAAARRHPHAFLLLAMRRFNAEGTFTFLEAHFGVLRDAGFDAGMTARIFRTLGYFLNGAGLADVATATAQADRTQPLRLDSLQGIDDYPLVRRIAPHLAQPSLDGIFEFGLERLLATLARAPKRLR